MSRVVDLTRRVVPKLSAPSGNVADMENTARTLMLTAVMAICSDCGDERIFVPVEDGCVTGKPEKCCEFCCTTCDAAVFLLDVVDNTGTADRRVA